MKKSLLYAPRSSVERRTRAIAQPATRASRRRFHWLARRRHLGCIGRRCDRQRSDGRHLSSAAQQRLRLGQFEYVDGLLALPATRSITWAKRFCHRGLSDSADVQRRAWQACRLRLELRSPRSHAFAVSTILPSLSTNGTLRELADTHFQACLSPRSPGLDVRPGVHSFCVTATGGSDVVGIGSSDVGDTAVNSSSWSTMRAFVFDGDGDGAGDPCDKLSYHLESGPRRDGDSDGLGDVCDTCVGSGPTAMETRWRPQRQLPGAGESRSERRGISNGVRRCL